DLVPVEGSVGNITLARELRRQRSWSDEKYWRIRQQLIDKGVLAVGGGKGGSVRRVGVQSELMGDEGEPPVGPPGSPFSVLKRVRLEGWKSFRDATLYVDVLTVLIGTNASGKSNALDGLEFLNRAALDKELSVALGGDPTLSLLRGGVE